MFCTKCQILFLAFIALLVAFPCVYADDTLADSTASAINDAFSQISTGPTQDSGTSSNTASSKPEPQLQPQPKPRPQPKPQSQPQPRQPRQTSSISVAEDRCNTDEHCISTSCPRSNPFDVNSDISGLISVGSDNDANNSCADSSEGRVPNGGSSAEGSNQGNSAEGSNQGTNEGSGANQQAPTSQTNSSGDNRPIITAESTVLHIGDSHSCGVYGKTIDSLMRQTGAAINTYAVAGSAPPYWLNGTVGKCGYFSKDQNGKVTQPAKWNTPMRTPLLKNLIAQYKPTVLVISLGANMVGYSASSIKKQIRSLCEMGKASGCKIVWVGPPDSDFLEASKVNSFYQILKTEISQYEGVCVDSRNYTNYPDGEADGLHYSGKKGRAIAKTWANEVMNEIQGK